MARPLRLISAVLFLAALQARSQEHSAGGMSASLLRRAHEVLQRAVTSHTVGSAVGLIARSNQIVFIDTVGEAEPGVPMPENAIMRLASITKPITAVAVLMLFEQGKLQLDDPVEKYLPEFHGLKVAGRDPHGQPSMLYDLERPITIYDLLTHQAGLAPDGSPELNSIWDQAKTVQEFSARLARLPLRFQPGTRFEYGPAYEVLTAIVELVTRQPYARFLTDEVLAPLKMTDTYFFVPPQKLQRLAAQYQKDSTGGALSIWRRRGQEEQPTEFYSGGGGLRSTVKDYYRFVQFLLNKGVLDGVRLLSPKAVELMTVNQVASRYPDENYGWGFGVEIRTSPAGSKLGSVGSYGWNGGTGTLFVADPSERLIVIVFVPTTPGTPGVDALRDAFVNAAYQAILR
jgi:CubicO group peptidase (beta-lactamase class C family)